MDASERKRKVIPAAVRVQVWEKYNGTETYYGKCFVCHSKIGPLGAWHASHVLADVQGGAPVVDNLRPCCASCNISMGSMDMREFCVRYSQPGTIAFSDEELLPFRQKIDTERKESMSAHALRSQTERVRAVKVAHAKCRWPTSEDSTCIRNSIIDGYCRGHHKTFKEFENNSLELYKKRELNPSLPPPRRYELYRQWAFRAGFSVISEIEFTQRTQECSHEKCTRFVAVNGLCASHQLKLRYTLGKCIGDISCDLACIEEYNLCRSHLRIKMDTWQVFPYKDHHFYHNPETEQVCFFTARYRPILIGVYVPNTNEIRSSSRWNDGIPSVKIRVYAPDELVTVGKPGKRFRWNGNYYKVVS